MLFTTATCGSKNAIEPSLSSTSLTNTPPSPILALANGESAATKFFISAPFMIVGFFPARCRIQPIMPTVVDFPLVPATPTPRAASLKRSARSLARLVERAVRTLDPIAPGLNDQSEGGHATTADAAKKVISKPGHWRNLQALSVKCNAG